MTVLDAASSRAGRPEDRDRGSERLLDSWPGRLEPEPVSRPGWRRLLARWVRLGALLGVVVAVVIVANDRIATNRAAASRLQIDDGLLVANQIDVISTSPGTISAVLVAPGDQVDAGEAVAIVDAIRPAPGGGQQVVGTELRAPLGGQVAAAPHHAGESVIAGQVLVQLYRPEDVHLEVRMENTGRALRLEPGMRGEVWTDGIDPIGVELVRIDPGLLTGDQRAGLLTLDLRFDAVEVVDPLLLGLSFDGWLDTTPPDAEELG